ncbi:hypothetical protein FRC02_003944, partial [Tulasnella sp. 418]
HQEIYQKAGILHRDISTNNVRIRDPPKVFVDGFEEEANEDSTPSSDEGFLIDFDLSVIDNCNDESRSERLARTGTFSFMAWQILGSIEQSVTQVDESPESPLHSYKHDLQSFFWVLLYICAGAPIFVQKPLDETHLSYMVMNIFLEPKRVSAWSLKHTFLTTNIIKIWVAEPFKGMLGVLSKMKALLSPEKWDDLTHDSFISILDEALQDPVIQERTLIPQHKFEPHYLEDPYQELISTNADPTPADGSKDRPSGSINMVRPDASGSGSRVNTRSRTRKHSRKGSSASSARTGRGLMEPPSSSTSRKRATDPPASSRESKRSRKG